MICSVHMKFKYPAGDQEERKHWKAVLSKLNAKCRSYRRPEPCSRDKRAASTVRVIIKVTFRLSATIVARSYGFLFRLVLTS